VRATTALMWNGLSSVKVLGRSWISGTEGTFVVVAKQQTGGAPGPAGAPGGLSSRTKRAGCGGAVC
jgi:hypothetical protein